jgi:GTP-binding protein
LTDDSKDLRPLFDVILQHVPPPEVNLDAPTQFQVNNLDHSEFVGRIAIGRLYAGKLRRSQRIALLGQDNKHIDYNIKQLLSFDRLGRTEVEQVTAGDLCAIVGLDEVEIGDTVSDIEHLNPLPPLKVDEPTLTMLFRINDSPFSGREGQYVTSRQLRERLMKELERNVALRAVPVEGKADEFMVSGRGLLHLGILLENMRREGYELSVGKPRVIMKAKNGMKLEPVEYLVIECPQTFVGAVMELVGNRRAECNKMDARGELTHLEFTIPARGLIGMKTRLLTATRGEAIMHHTFYDYQPSRGTIPSRINGVMVSTESGPATGHAIENLQERGILFVSPQDQVYEGQIVGEHCRDNDLPVNICREKKLTNIRSATSEKTVVLKTPLKMTLELALEYIEDDEYVEVTPESVRLRKILLKEADRKKSDRSDRKREE